METVPLGFISALSQLYLLSFISASSQLYLSFISALSQRYRSSNSSFISRATPVWVCHHKKNAETLLIPLCVGALLLLPAALVVFGGGSFP